MGDGYTLGSVGEWNDRFDALVRLGKERFGLEVRYKESSGFMRFLGWILFFVEGFMDQYTTTIGRRVWFPTRDEVVRLPRKHFRILAHELIHMERSRGFRGIGYTIRYLFPQILAPLALLSLLAFVSQWWLFCLLFLTALLPWPAPGRADEEAWGYAMTTVVESWQYGRPWDGKTIPPWIQAQFDGWSYYRMAWEWEPVRGKIERYAGKMEADTTWTMVHTIRLIAQGGPEFARQMLRGV